MGSLENTVFLKRWLKTHEICVLATCNGNVPWAATVNYTGDENMNIYISTSTDSLKYINSVVNPIVGLVIDSQDRKGTLQIQGKAEFRKGKPFSKPNLVVKPTYMIFKQKNEKTGKLIVIEHKP